MPGDNPSGIKRSTIHLCKLSISGETAGINLDLQIIYFDTNHARHRPATLRNCSLPLRLKRVPDKKQAADGTGDLRVFSHARIFGFATTPPSLRYGTPPSPIYSDSQNVLFSNEPPAAILYVQKFPRATETRSPRRIFPKQTGLVFRSQTAGGSPFIFRNRLQRKRPGINSRASGLQETNSYLSGVVALM